VIAVTLTFRSIDDAVRVLREIPESALVSAPRETPESDLASAPVETKGEPLALKQSKASKDAAESVVAQPHPTAKREEAQAQAAVAVPAEAAPSVDYLTLQKAVFALAAKSREAAAAVAQSFGVRTFKELPADKWADALTAVNAKLSELEGV